MHLNTRLAHARDGRTYEIVPGRVRDSGAILDHFHEARRTDPAADVPEFDELRSSVAAMEGLVRKMERSSNELLALACAGGSIVGSLTVHGGAYRKNRHVGRIGMRVVPEWRRQGVGRALLDTAIEASRASDVLEILCLEVFSSNAPALALYRDTGFLEDGRRAGFIRQADRDDDLVLMSLRIDAGEDVVS